MRRTTTTGLAAGGAVALLAALVSAPASAAPGPGGQVGSQVGAGADDSGLSARAVEVRVQLTGNGVADGGVGGGAATRVVRKPPACWWDGPLYDAAEFRDAKNDARYRAVGAEALRLPPVADVDALAEEDGGWFLLTGRSTSGDDLAGTPGRLFDYTDAADDCRAALGAGATGGPGSEWLFLPTGTAPPAPPPPVLTAEELREVAEEAMTIPDPEVATNPVGRGYVRLPSWLWLEDGPSAADGFAPVEVTATAGASSATVRAAPERFTATSATGDATCSADSARTAWTASASEDAACLLVPERSSAASGDPAGWPVVVTTSYATSWEGRTAGGPLQGGGLGLETRSSTFGLPVAEVQSLVLRDG
ncbi:hypothetical protein [uncultured Pseudokineococcus sp.]|uniref:hypothetical protein n=1 Tax=uncultured Pseudokineococcus sp. TaxID=1642928 RepID=UPI00261B8890|nr:hypothetical protein [uncultured Pseudokineococcus sp.]